MSSSQKEQDPRRCLVTMTKSILRLDTGMDIPANVYDCYRLLCPYMQSHGLQPLVHDGQWSDLMNAELDLDLGRRALVPNGLPCHTYMHIAS